MHIFKNPIDIYFNPPHPRFLDLPKALQRVREQYLGGHSCVLNGRPDIKGAFTGYCHVGYEVSISGVQN